MAIEKFEDFLNEAKFKKGDMVVISAPHYVEDIQDETGMLLMYNDVWQVEKTKGKKLVLKGSEGTFEVDAKYFMMDESVNEKKKTKSDYEDIIDKYESKIWELDNANASWIPEDRGKKDKMRKTFQGKIDAAQKALDKLTESLDEGGKANAMRYFKAKEKKKSQSDARKYNKKKGEESPEDLELRAAAKMQKEELTESVMSELDLLAKEAKDFEAFKKEAMKEFPELKKDKEAEKFLLLMFQKANESVTEGKVTIKRKYGVYDSKVINSKAPLRNTIIKYIGNEVMTEEQIKNMLTRVEEDLGKSVNQTRWFKANMRYFKLSKNESGEKTYQLSRMGKKIFDQVCRIKTTTNTKLVAESLEDFIAEGKTKMMVAKKYDKLSDDEKMEKLLTVFSDPDDAEAHLDMKFDELPPEAQSNMYEGKSEVQQAVKHIMSGAGWASTEYLDQFGGPMGLSSKDLSDLAVELAKKGLLFNEDDLEDNHIMDGDNPADDDINPVSVADAKKMKF